MTKLVLDRRKLLVGAGGLALFSGLGRVAWAAPKFTANPFSLGVASGDPWPDGFVLWTRLAPKPLEEHGGMPMAAVAVRWEVAEDDRFTKIVRTGEAVARPELGHSVHVEVGGLRPRRPYWYRFRVDGAEASPVGTARTAPAPAEKVDRVRMAVVGCQAYPHGWYEAYRHLSEEAELDAVFHYGDYIYETGGRPTPARLQVRDAAGNVVDRSHFGDEIYSVDDYRRRYAQYKTDPHLQAAHASAAFVSSFDDHEIDNNWADMIDQDGTPPEAFALRRFAAMQAWYENMPVRRAQLPRAGGLTMYRRIDYGGLLRMHVLDTRSYRDDQLCQKPGEQACRTENGPDTTLLGSAQEAWLAEGLDNGARWNLIAQQVLVMPLFTPGPNGRQMRPGFDPWSGYPQARERLVKTITDRDLTNVVIATGDAHMHGIGTVPVRDDEPDGPAAATEFLTTSITSGGDGQAEASDGFQALLDGSPNLALLNHQRGYQTFDITAKEWRTDVKVMDRVQTPGGKLSTLARFTVTPDKAALHRI
ncbi:alkaline phosphatase D family protein [Sphingomonas sp. LY54]|uniref:alkaline phosphatase D family protein n=1 Tax=Sphingomonas sp. LY54 TaxID=3095343 RepID=UPI002D77BEE6|nr:alkaline phosphatase D family protein [Sphingomonas sp. LY54]WRP28415.1 alkaline phosphatase D family protein [Sphingomonas sp. LY54]